MTERPPALAPEIEALVLKELEKRVKARTELVKVTVGQHYGEGDKHTFRSPLDDAKLGQVWRTDPEPQWQVVDRDALIAELRRARHNIEIVDEIVGTDEQVLEVLAAHAPHLLVRIERVSQEAIDYAVALSKSRGKAAYPGIEKKKPAGSLTVKPDKNAAEVITRMIDAKLITWDGRPALPAAEDEAS